MNPHGNPNIKNYAKGRPKGSKNKSTILKHILADIFSGIPDKEIKAKIKGYMAESKGNFFQVYSLAARWQIDEMIRQGNLFPEGNEIENEEELIAQAERESERYGKN